METKKKRAMVLENRRWEMGMDLRMVLEASFGQVREVASRGIVPQARRHPSKSSGCGMACRFPRLSFDV